MVAVGDGLSEAVGPLLGVLVAATAVRLGVGVVPSGVGDAVAVSAGDGATVAVGVVNGLREAVGLLLGVLVAAIAVTLGVGVAPGTVGTAVVV